MPEKKPAHLFTPYVSVTKRDDGTWEVDFDWSDTYVENVNGERGFTVAEQEEACAAMDRWIKTIPRKYLIRPI